MDTLDCTPENLLAPLSEGNSESDNWHGPCKGPQPGNLSLVQIILNGIISGSAIALLAVAFQMVYLPTRVFFIGLAGIYSIAPFLVFTASKAGLPLAVGIALAVAASVLVADGASPEDAIDRVRVARPNAVETAVQRKFVGAFRREVKV